MNKLFLTVLLAFIVVGFSSCSGTKVEGNYPGSQEDERRKKIGNIGGGEGGLITFGGSRKSQETSGNSGGIGINKYLWRATLDTISFMPLSSADPFGGVIITDWYENPNAKGSKFKLNIVINSAALRSDAVKVSAFKKDFNEDLNTWSDSEIDKNISTQIENKILTRARQLKVRKQSN